MLSVVITGHGNFATGIKSMLDLVLGDCDNTYFVDFSENMNSDDLQKIFKDIFLQSEKNVIFLCDIAGGTPFNQASILLHEHNRKGVIGGISIPLVLEVLDQRESMSANALLVHAKKEASENIKIFGEAASQKNNTIGDGI